ncbi:MAG: aspartate ammonia-lyase [Bacteroidetes bacterium]|nr:aspartate ammonia-lyase [Bacteroidota bacterium]
MRKEKDFLGMMDVPEDALYGIHALRAYKNFPDTTPFQKEWFQAMGLVKHACYITYSGFKKALNKSDIPDKQNIKLINGDVIDTLLSASLEIAEGKWFDQFIVPAISGGAGTSINMNINEIIANVALLKLGNIAGSYDIIDPVEDANIFQSTNDVVPTALKVAVMKLLQQLETSINLLRQQIEGLENKYRSSLRLGYTQMQEAVPSTWGRLFSNYNDALSRDWWRVSKCFERIKLVNLGGGAIGTGIGIPRYFIMEVVSNLQQLTGLPVTRSENLSDTTSNLDSFVEIHAIIKANAINLEKFANDLRLLAADISKDQGLEIPQVQVGSSIMPGKVNPVIPEFIISAAHKIYANDQLIANLSAQGCLELNAYVPVIGHAIIESLKLLIGMNNTFCQNLIGRLIINEKHSLNLLFFSPSITTALNPFIGYHKASELSVLMKKEKIDVFEANRRLMLIDTNWLTEIMSPQKLTQLGYSIYDLTQTHNSESG